MGHSLESRVVGFDFPSGGCVRPFDIDVWALVDHPPERLQTRLPPLVAGLPVFEVAAILGAVRIGHKGMARSWENVAQGES